MFWITYTGFHHQLSHFGPCRVSTADLKQHLTFGFSKTFQLPFSNLCPIFSSALVRKKEELENSAAFVFKANFIFWCVCFNMGSSTSKLTGCWLQQKFAQSSCLSQTKLAFATSPRFIGFQKISCSPRWHRIPAKAATACIGHSQIILTHSLAHVNLKLNCPHTAHAAMIKKVHHTSLVQVCRVH